MKIFLLTLKACKLFSLSINHCNFLFALFWLFHWMYLCCSASLNFWFFSLYYRMNERRRMKNIYTVRFHIFYIWNLFAKICTLFNLLSILLFSLLSVSNTGVFLSLNWLDAYLCGTDIMLNCIAKPESAT